MVVSSTCCNLELIASFFVLLQISSSSALQPSSSLNQQTLSSSAQTILALVQPPNPQLFGSWVGWQTRSSLTQILQDFSPLAVHQSPPWALTQSLNPRTPQPLGLSVPQALKSSASGVALRMAAPYEREMEGKLFRYGPDGPHVAFQSGPPSANKVAIFIGGLTDGLMSLPYTPALSARLNELGWRVVQPLLSSSHTGYGASSLQKDSDELDMLLKYLSKSGMITAVIIGHSTGCQDAVWHASKGKLRGILKAIVLQGPVSDRQFLETIDSTPKLVDEANKYIKEGRPNAFLHEDADYCEAGAAMSAYRFHSLATRLGDDDMFSSDLTDAELSRLFADVSVPVLVACSMKDEYVPEHVAVKTLADRLAAAFPEGQTVLCGGNHALSDEGADTFIDAVESLLKSIK